MNSYPYPKPFYRKFPARRMTAGMQQASPTEGRSMNKVVAWGLTILAGGFLIWQLVSSAPLVPDAVSAVLLAILSLLAGMRLGIAGATAYIRDVQRLNKVLAEQHHDLEEVNANLLQQLTAASKAQPAERNLS